jgi:serine/threonine protein phosphatase PrpC
MILKVVTALMSVLGAVTAVYKPGSFFQSKTVIIPHDSKRATGGEDSADSSDTLIVVSDGVGGGALHGFNPGLFSKELTRSALEFHEKNPKLIAVDLLKNGCTQAGEQHSGSATVVVLKLIKDMKISAANLGDSGYALFHVLPDDTLEMYFRSPTQ